MIYLDTSLIISYVDEEDPRHADAEELIESVGLEKRVISPLVLVELASVYSRASLENPLQPAFYSIADRSRRNRYRLQRGLKTVA